LERLDQVGIRLVRGHPDAGQLEISVNKVVDVDHDTVELSQFESGSVQNEQATTNVESQDMIRENLVDEVQLSQVDSRSPQDTCHVGKDSGGLHQEEKKEEKEERERTRKAA
jgi:hypothetical protein